MVTDSNRKIKIAQVITRMDWAGVPDIVRIICRNLGSNYEVKLITGPGSNLTTRTKKFLEEFKDNTIIVPQLRRNINLFWDLFALIRLLAIFKKEKFDIVQVHTAKAGFLGRIAARWAGVPKVIYMPHGHVFYGYFNLFISKIIIGLERFAAGFADKIILLTELGKKDFLSLGIKEPGGIEVIPSGLELDCFPDMDTESKMKKRKELGLETDAVLVGMACRLEPVKGCEYFIEAALAMAKKVKDIQFVVVGEGSLRLPLEVKVLDSALKERIKFLGWREDSLEIISVLDILVQPSLNEAVGRVLLEAQAQGVPVIATKVGGIPEIIKDLVTGILIPSRNAKAIVQEIYRLLENENLRQTLASQAKKQVRENFSSEKMMEKIIHIYSQLMNR